MTEELPNAPEAFARFECARLEYIRALRECEDAKPQRAVPREITRKLFVDAAQAMLAYRLPDNWPAGATGEPLHPFPPVLAYICADYVRYFLAGKIPGPVADLLRQGAPSNGPEELRDQGWAVAYHLAVADGLIVDPKPTATLSAAFGRRTRTIQRWIVQQTEKGIVWQDFVPSSEYRQAGDFIQRRMREAGARYAIKGRTATPRDPDLKARPAPHR